MGKTLKSKEVAVGGSSWYPGRFLDETENCRVTNIVRDYIKRGDHAEAISVIPGVPSGRPTRYSAGEAGIIMS